MKLINVTKELKEIEDTEQKMREFMSAINYTKIILKDAEEVDAVPVEWIEQYMTEENESVLKLMLKKYKEEKEHELKRNED